MIDHMIDGVYELWLGTPSLNRITLFKVQKSHPRRAGRLRTAPDRTRFISTGFDLCMSVCSVCMFVCTADTSLGLGCLSRQA